MRIAFEHRTGQIHRLLPAAEQAVLGCRGHGAGSGDCLKRAAVDLSGDDLRPLQQNLFRQIEEQRLHSLKIQQHNSQENDCGRQNAQQQHAVADAEGGKSHEGSGGKKPARPLVAATCHTRLPCKTLPVSLKKRPAGETAVGISRYIRCDRPAVAADGNPVRHRMSFTDKNCLSFGRRLRAG